MHLLSASGHERWFNAKEMRSPRKGPSGVTASSFQAQTSRQVALLLCSIAPAGAIFVQQSRHDHRETDSGE
jgi:hypothetical protein